MTLATIGAAVAGATAAAGILELAEARASQPRRTRGRVRSRAARFVSLLSRLGRQVGLPRPDAAIWERLEAAGSPVALQELLAIKAGAAAAAALGALPLAAAAPGRLGLLAPVAAAGGAFAAPDLWLRRRRRARVRRAATELPDVLDLLRVAMEAGLPVRRAVAEVGRRHGGLLAAELRRVAALLALGSSRAEALSALERRAPAPGVPALVAALERADHRGTPPGEALAALALDARADRARATREAAARAGPQIQLVVALLLVPSAMLLVAAALVPSVLS